MLRILLLIGYLGIAISSPSCDYVNYSEVQESYKFHRTPKTWLEARKTCYMEDATLAMPKNEAEVAVLKRIFDGYPATMLKDVFDPNYIFLGFHDIFQEMEFVTDEGIPLQYFYHEWGPSEPNNHEGKENCLTLNRSGFLNDFNCDSLVVFICQKNKKRPKYSKDNKCITDDPEYKFLKSSNKFYKLHLNQKVWPEARAICHAEGGSLAIIKNEAEENFLVKIFREKRKYFMNSIPNNNYALLGFHDLFKENYFFTLKGDELQTTGYTRWNSGEPNNGGGTENCGSMYLNGKLNDISCSKPYVFFCEIEIDANISL